MTLTRRQLNEVLEELQRSCRVPTNICSDAGESEAVGTGGVHTHTHTPVTFLLTCMQREDSTAELLLLVRGERGLMSFIQQPFLGANLFSNPTDAALKKTKKEDVVPDKNPRADLGTFTCSYGYFFFFKLFLKSS